MAHIADRFIIHFFASGGVVLCALFALQYFRRKTKSDWLPEKDQAQLTFVALGVFAAAALREAWDVHNGQTVLKACFDYASWFLGCGLTAYGLYRQKRR